MALRGFATSTLNTVKRFQKTTWLGLPPPKDREGNVGHNWKSFLTIISDAFIGNGLNKKT
jgi:hypothetical protein